jgi:hypothetical protein
MMVLSEYKRKNLPMAEVYNGCEKHRNPPGHTCFNRQSYEDRLLHEIPAAYFPLRNPEICLGKMLYYGGD